MLGRLVGPQNSTFTTHPRAYFPSGTLQPYPRRPASLARQPSSHQSPRIMAKIWQHRLKNGATYANIDTTSPRKGPKMPQDRRELLPETLQIIKKPLKTLKNRRFFKGFCYLGFRVQDLKKLPRSLQKCTQVGHLGSILAPSCAT